jgi:hypothetical protein
MQAHAQMIVAPFLQAAEAASLQELPVLQIYLIVYVQTCMLACLQCVNVYA